MTEKTIVHVMRHGEVYNPDKVLYGRLPDYHLSERGRAQAQRVADWLAARDIVYVVASPLERAQETAGPIAEHHGLPIDTDDDLIDRPISFRARGSHPATARCATPVTGGICAIRVRRRGGSPTRRSRADDGRPASRQEQGCRP